MKQRKRLLYDSLFNHTTKENKSTILTLLVAVNYTDGGGGGTWLCQQVIISAIYKPLLCGWTANRLSCLLSAEDSALKWVSWCHCEKNARFSIFFNRQEERHQLRAIALAYRGGGALINAKTLHAGLRVPQRRPSSTTLYKRSELR